jgi:hypothetical protein
MKTKRCPPSKVRKKLEAPRKPRSQRFRLE